MNSSMMDNKYSTLTTAYDEMINCRSNLTKLKHIIEHQFNPTDNESFSNPLSYSPRTDIENATRKFRIECIKFIVRDLSEHKIYKNLIIDEERILKLFGVGYGSIEKYGTGFDSQNVVDCFNELYPLEYIESIIYTQILHNAQKSIFGFYHKSDPIIKRFGKCKDGIILQYNSSRYTTSNSNYTSALLKLLDITLIPVSPSSAAHLVIEPGEKYTTLCTRSIRAYQNGKVKIVFKSVEDADTISNLLLQEDKENVL